MTNEDPGNQQGGDQPTPTEAELAAFRQWLEWQRANHPEQAPAPPPAVIEPNQPAQQQQPQPVQQPPQPQQGQQQGQGELHNELALMRQQLTEMRESQQRVEYATNPPLWKRILRSTPVRWAFGILVLLAVGSWAINHFFGSSQDPQDPQAALPAPKSKQQTTVGVQDPKDAIAQLYRSAAQAASDPAAADTDAEFACHMFTERATKQFASQHGASSCPDAIKRIKPSDPDSYREQSLSQLPDTPEQGTRMTIDSCDIDVKGGPRLGTFTLTQRDSSWVIDGVQPSRC